MRRIPRVLLLLPIIAGLPYPTHALSTQDTRLYPFTARYKLSHGSMTFGNVTVTLKVDSKGNYHYQAHTVTTGFVAILRNDEVLETSEGKIEQQSIVPTHYSYSHKKPDKHHQVNLTFKWSEKKVINRTPESLWTMSITPGVQDKFSQQLALIVQLNHGREAFHFKVADGGRLKDYKYLNEGSEQTATPAGYYHTIRLARQKQGKASKATFWMAPELNYLPVKILRREGDDRFEMVLESIAWKNG